MEKIRLNKYLSDRGVVSRREADRLTEAGRILVNGERASVGMKVSDEDIILVDGKEAAKEAPEKVILAVHKPRGVVCTSRAFKGEKNIVDMVKYDTRLYPVGRLDKDSEGLIFLTNDGEFGAELMKASGRHEKEYEVVVHKEMTDAFLKRMEKGIFLEELDKTTSPCKIVKTGDRRFCIILTQGLNRQIRRMCEAMGYHVTALKRVRIMNVLLGELPSGAWREVSGEEKEKLLSAVKAKKTGRKRSGRG